MSESKNKLTIEQLKFALEIEAEDFRFVESRWYVDYYKNICIESGKYEFWDYGSSRWVSMNGLPIDWSSGKVFRINFTPLDDYYADKDADIRAQNAATIEGGEQPLEWPIGEELIGRKVRFDGYKTRLHSHWGFEPGEVYTVAIDARGYIGPVNGRGATAVENFDGDFNFTLMPEEKQEWPEERQDAIGQNGNDGEHYEKPETTHDVSHHKRKDGTDLIDEWWDKYEPEVARVLMWEMVNKYHNRLGKKDPVHIEVAKMADYMARWSEKELALAK